VGTKIVGEFLRPNLIYNSAKTEKEQANKMAEVSQAIGFILKYERIVDANTRITPEHLQKIKSYIRAWQDKNEKMSVEETYKDGKQIGKTKNY
jgi:membrane-associated HD superfamily phosphohydrolase